MFYFNYLRWRCGVGIHWFTFFFFNHVVHWFTSTVPTISGAGPRAVSQAKPGAETPVLIPYLDDSNPDIQVTCCLPPGFTLQEAGLEAELEPAPAVPQAPRELQLELVA